MNISAESGASTNIHGSVVGGDVIVNVMLDKITWLAQSRKFYLWIAGLILTRRDRGLLTGLYLISIALEDMARHAQQPNGHQSKT